MDNATNSKLFNTYKARLRASRNLSEPHWDRAIDNYKHYLGRLDVGNTKENDYPFQSTMVVPVSYETVETVMPRIIGKDPEFTAIAMEPDDVPSEATAKMVIEHEYNNPKLDLLGEPIYLKLQRGTKEQLITGNVVYRAFWRRQTRKQMTYLASNNKTGHDDEADIKKVLEAAAQVGASSDTTYSKKLIDAPFLDDFDMKHLPFFWFFPDPTFAETGRMRYKIERDFMTFEELADEAEIFGYDKPTMDSIKEKVDRKEAGFTPDIKKDFLYEYHNMFQNMNEASFRTDDDKIPLLIVDKMWMGDRVAVYVNEKYELTGEKGMRNPYDVMVDPFIFGHDVTIPHSYFSWGEIDAIKRLEDGMTDILNMRFDNLLQAMLNFWVYNPNLIADGDEFLPIPSSLTAVTDVDRAVRMLSGKDVTPTAFKESDEIYKIIQRVTGANDYTKGMEGDSIAGRTYGGMRLVQEAANARFIVKSRLFEKLTLKALGYFMLEMSRQFINKDRVRRIEGEAGQIEEQKVQAGMLKAIKGMFDIKVIPNAAMVIDQQAEAMKMNAVADRFVSQKGPFANIPPEVYDKFLLDYLQAYGVTDAVYWIRLIKQAREKAPPPQPAQQTPPAGAGMPSLGGAGGAPGGGVPGMDVMQPDQGFVPQPDPISSLLNAAAGGNANGQPLG
jgi:hypothetical protein